MSSTESLYLKISFCFVPVSALFGKEVLGLNGASQTQGPISKKRRHWTAGRQNAKEGKGGEKKRKEKKREKEKEKQPPRRGDCWFNNLPPPGGRGAKKENNTKREAQNRKEDLSPSPR